MNSIIVGHIFTWPCIGHRLCAQKDDADLSYQFGPIAETLAAQETLIIDELNGAQGTAMDIGGYYQPDTTLATQAMRPSATLNEIIDNI